MHALAPAPVHRGTGVNWPLVQNGIPHVVFTGWKPSVGQVAALPAQFSATSQLPALGRQTVVFGDSTSVGHVAEVPLHVSTGSHAPALGRHTVLPPESTFAGQVVEVPVQLSAGSHAPPLMRQTVVAGSSVSAGQVAAPAQRSSLSQAPTEGRHTKVVGCRLHCPTAEQTSHAPLHAELQHTPLAQKFELHSAPDMQVPPSAFFV